MKIDIDFDYVNLDEQIEMGRCGEWTVGVMSSFCEAWLSQSAERLATISGNISLLEETNACRVMMVKASNSTAIFNAEATEQWTDSVDALARLQGRLQFLRGIVEHARLVQRQARRFCWLFRGREHALYIRYLLYAKQYELKDCSVSLERRHINTPLSAVQGQTFDDIISCMNKDFWKVKEGIVLFDKAQTSEF